MTDSKPETPNIGYGDVFQTTNFRRAYLKCRLVHMEGRSFVMPDVLMASDERRQFYVPKFFQPNRIAFFGAGGSDDLCRFVVETIGRVDIEIAFFRRDLVKQCVDQSFIYKCAFHSVSGQPIPNGQGDWRSRGNTFELALYHHTNAAGETGIKTSGEIWSSAWNIQGTTELKNIAYGYFTCIPRIDNVQHLHEVAMSDDGLTHFIPTNAPLDAQFAQPLKVYRQTTADRDRSLMFWVNVETISPSHLWLHRPLSAPAYYEIVLPKIFRVGVEPCQTIPFKGNALTLMPQDCKNFAYVIVGDADSADGLIAPYHEEETLQLAKVDAIPPGNEIIERWYEMQNSDVFSRIKIELAELTKDKAL